MEITLFGCKNTTLEFINNVSHLGFNINLITISPSLGKKNKVAGYFDLTKHKNKFSNIFIADTYTLRSDRCTKYFNDTSKEFRLGFAIGWQRLIPENILNSFKLGIFGMHGSSQNLPNGKGRSPLNWSIIEGRKHFYTNLFKYNSGIDSGPILGTVCFSILPHDNIETLHYKNTIAMVEIISKNLKMFKSGKLKLKKQKDGKSTYYPKRDPNDGEIDWNDDIKNIDRLIKAVTTPFFGSFSYINEHKIFIFNANIFYTDLEDHAYISNHVGQIVKVFENKKFLIKCNGGVLIVHNYKINKYNIKTNDRFSVKRKNPKIFERNIYGFYDV